MPIRWHEEDPVLLHEAIRFTAAQTGFSTRLIEKDYFCSIVLEYLAANDNALIFKGGTCLAKVHVGFYRLSEDLDFSISTPVDASRADRKKLSANFKEVLAELPAALPAFRIVETLQGANNSSQYTAVVGYESLLDSHVEPVRIEIGLREPQLVPPDTAMSRTILLNPLDHQPLVAAYPVQCLSYQEAMAEKLRAALCRREIAVRDFFDVDYAIQHALLNIDDHELLELLHRKIDMPATEAIDITPERLIRLTLQVEAELRPVLREQDFMAFDLGRAVERVKQVVRALGSLE